MNATERNILARQLAAALGFALDGEAADVAETVACILTRSEGLASTLDDTRIAELLLALDAHKATREQLDSLSDQLTDIRCAIRDALETAHGRELLDYAQDCVKRCEDIVGEVRKKSCAFDDPSPTVYRKGCGPKDHEG